MMNKSRIVVSLKIPMVEEVLSSNSAPIRSTKVSKATRYGLCITSIFYFVAFNAWRKGEARVSVDSDWHLLSNEPKDKKLK